MDLELSARRRVGLTAALADRVAAGRWLRRPTGTPAGFLLPVLLLVSPTAITGQPQPPETEPVAEAQRPVVEAPTPEVVEPPEVEAQSAVAAPAAPPEPPEELERTGSSDTRVAVGSRVHVRSGETVSDVVAIGAGLIVDGEVEGNATAVAGMAVIDGRVTGNVVAVGGSVRLGENAEVLGDVASFGGDVEREPGAVVRGRVSEVSLGAGLDRHDWEWSGRGFRGGTSLGWSSLLQLVGILVGFLLLVLVTGFVQLVASGPTARLSTLIATEPFKVALVGLASEILVVFGGLALLVFLVVSIVGWPLLLLVPFAILLLIILFILGFVGACLAAGRTLGELMRLEIKSAHLQLLLGLVAAVGLWNFGQFLEVLTGAWPFAWFFELFGGLVLFATVTLGFGAIVLTRGGSLSGLDRGPLAAPPPLPEIGVEEPTVEDDAIGGATAGDAPTAGAD